MHVSTLPLFENMRTRCAQSGWAREIMVIYCPSCAEVVGGPHYHRDCRGCGHRWLEQTREMPREP